MTDAPQVHELRLVVTTDDYDQALRFYRDVLGLREQASFTAPGSGGRLTILDAGRATMEIAEPAYAEYIDDSRLAGPGRLQLTLFEELAG